MKIGDKVKVVADWWLGYTEGIITEIVEDCPQPYTVEFSSYTNPPVAHCYFEQYELEVVNENP